MDSKSDLSLRQIFWVEFIELYKSKPVLWKYGSEIYKDRRGKKRAYMELVEKMREVDPNADIDRVKKKINSFRSCYRRKLSIAQEQINLGLEPEIKWVYFRYFNFLREIKCTVDSENDWSCGDDSRFDQDHLQNIDTDEENAAMEHDSYEREATRSFNSISSDHDESLNETYKTKNEKNDFDERVALNSEEEQTFWIEFIQLYESKPELWKRNSDVYKDRDAKKFAYVELVEKMQEVYPNADAELVKRKINILRSSYRKMLNKIKRDISFGRKPVNNWVYFKYFSFLSECKDPLEDYNIGDDYDNSYGALENVSDTKSQVDSDVEELGTFLEFPTKRYQENTSPVPTISYNELNHSGHEATMEFSVNPTANHKFWIEFIKLYQSKPELWKCDSEIYKNRKAKKSAYEVLAQKMREVYPNADADMVRKKINSLRSTYRKTLRKSKRGIRLGKKPIYKWVYLDHFAFLKNSNNSQENEDEDNEYDQLSDISDSSEHNFVVDDMGDMEVEYLPKKDVESSELSPVSTQEEIHDVQANVAYRKLKETNDEADILGISWAYQYRSLSETQKIFAKKAIDDILFEARLGTLKRNSIKIN
ncbi:uncharacterized protein LOC101459501 [Ceratitis capitata]|uniref:uncharacterized protein LOC101459501 n=1 Tax=Ceratitis capitata TaxID=7213 RepID=UPI00032A34F8|nr:uncharacterized protein LOC101459501 [Ceratitis capitata]